MEQFQSMNFDKVYSFIAIPVAVCEKQTGRFVSKNNQFKEVFNSDDESLRSFLENRLHSDSPTIPGESYELLKSIYNTDTYLWLKTQNESHKRFTVSSSLMVQEQKELLVLSFAEHQFNEEQQENFLSNAVTLRSLIDSSFGGAAIYVDDVIIGANETLCEMSGYAYHELMGMNILDLMEPSFRDPMSICSQKGEAYKIECLGLRKDNTTYDIEIQERRISFGRQYVCYIEFIDISERKKAEERVRISEERLRYVFEATNDALWDWNIESKELFFSKRYYTMLGFKPNEFEPSIRDWRKALHPEDQVWFNRDIRNFFEGEMKTYDAEFRLPTKTNEWHWVRGRAKIVERDEQGKPVRLVGSLIDINHRKLMEIKLLEREQTLRSIADNLPSGIIYQLSMDGDGDNRWFNYVSANVKGIYGLTAKEILDDRNKLYDRIVEEDRPMLNKLEQESFEKMESFKTEIRVLDRDDNIRWVSIASAPRKLNNGLIIWDGVEVDITDRKLAEEAVKASEERLRFVFEATNDGIWDWNLDENIIFFSQSAYTMLGYELTDVKLTYEKWVDLLHPDDKEETLDLLHQYITGQVPEYVTEYRLRKKDGEWLWIHARGKIVDYNKEGKAKRIVGTHMDLSAQKKLQSELRDSALFLQTVLDTIPVNVYWKDKRLNYRGCNMSFAKTLGYDNPADIVGKNNDGIYRFSANMQLEADEIDVVTNGVSKVYHEEPFISENGRKNWAHLTKVPLRNSQGEIVGLLGAFSIITERVMSRNAIELEKAYFEELFQSLPEGVILLDPDNRIQRSNREFQRMFQYSEEEVVGKTLDELIVPKHMAGNALKFDRVIKSDVPFHHETIRRTKDGKIIDVSILGSPMTFKGGKLAVYGIYRDITERKRVEYELSEKTREIETQNEEYRAINIELFEAKQRAEESDKLKSAFLANMSHEIRTPMNGILGFSQLLGNPELSQEEFDQYLDIIQRCSNQLLSIIDDLIDISKIESNQIKVFRSSTDINQLLHELYLMFKGKVETKGIELSYSLGLKEGNCIVSTDRGRVLQILTNLLGNAVKFTKEGSIRFGYKRKDAVLEFYVEDTGIGIMPEMGSKIFERFMQYETEIVQQMGGTGLGLAISEAYVKKLGGDIRYESVPHKGSTFYFTIPYLPDATMVQPEGRLTDFGSSEHAALIQNAHILIAEDDDVNFFVLEEMLQEHVVRIHRASTGNHAIQMVKDNPEINLVLMDIKMPEKNGYEATKEIKKFRPELPVIAQTAYAFISDKDKAFASGCDDYISKPISKQELFKVISKYLKE